MTEKPCPGRFSSRKISHPSQRRELHTGHFQSEWTTQKINLRTSIVQSITLNLAHPSLFLPDTLTAFARERGKTRMSGDLRVWIPPMPQSAMPVHAGIISTTLRSAGGITPSCSVDVDVVWGCISMWCQSCTCLEEAYDGQLPALFVSNRRWD